MDRIINVKVSGNYISKDGKVAGVQGEGNMTNLRITFDEGWDGYAKTVTFLDAKGGNPVRRLLTIERLENIKESTRVYLVPIPPEPMKEEGYLTFVIDGYKGEFEKDTKGDYILPQTVEGKRQRSISDTLEVKYAPIVEDAPEPSEPDATPMEEMQAQIESILADIQESVKVKAEAKGFAEDAETSANKAESSVGKVSYIGDNGNWFAWDGNKGEFYDTGVKAQAGSTVYVGDNPPDNADVWINPDGEFEEYATKEELGVLAADLGEHRQDFYDHRDDYEQHCQTFTDHIENHPQYHNIIYYDVIDIDPTDNGNLSIDDTPVVLYYVPKGYEKAPFGDEECLVIWAKTSIASYQAAVTRDLIKVRLAPSEFLSESAWHDLDYATKDFVNSAVESLRTEHAPHLSGSEIDTKYKVGEYIPSLILYEGGYDWGEYYNGKLYENAPFEGDGIIITHSCTDSDGYPLTYQFAISYDGIIKHRWVSDEEFSDVAWSENLIPTKLSHLEDDIGFDGVKTMYDTLMDRGYDTDTIISAFKSAFEACQIANENVGRIESVESSIAEHGSLINDNTERIESVETGLNANVGKIEDIQKDISNALRGYASGNVVSLDDVSPVPHTVKANVYSKNLININASTTNNATLDINDDGTVKVIRGTATNSSPSLSWRVGKYQDFVGKTLTLSVKLLDVSNTTNGKSFNAFYRGIDAQGNLVGKEVTLGQTSITKDGLFTFTVPENAEAEVLTIRFYVGYLTPSAGDSVTLSNIQLEYGTQATEYKPYSDITNEFVTVQWVAPVPHFNGVVRSKTYYPDDNGNIEFLTEYTMKDVTITPNNVGTIIDVEYNRDINKAFAELQAMILGG